MVGFGAANKNILDTKFICPLCSFILRDPLQSIICGHRFCQSCMDRQNQTSIQCTECQIETSSDEVMIDRAFRNDMQSLPIICSQCDWNGVLKDYQEHLDRSHLNPICLYCQQQFSTVSQLNEHQVSQCQKLKVDCLLKNFGCHEPIFQHQLHDHCTSEQHQQAIEQIKLQLSAIQMSITTEDSTRLNEELNEHKRKLENLLDSVTETQFGVAESCIQSSKYTKREIEIYPTLSLWRKKIDDAEYVSHDGTFTWKITGFREKMTDAQSERQTSIYSPPFYSSPTGYKMRARLYLHGDGNAHRTHMSLFFVLMRGRNDAILKFPFNYKVTFCLYDQTPQLRHIIDSFRPDIKSNSFQRPRSEMNIASGIPKFFPLAMIQQEGNPYVKDDTMFIKVMVDFGDMPKTLLPYALSLNPGLPSGIQQEMIRRETERRDQQKIAHR